MGGKTSTSTSQVQVPASVLAMYNSVNAKANATANTPFQTYGTTGTSVAPDYSTGNTGTFVAPINSEQTSGIAATNTAANEAQPYYNTATGVLGATQSGVNPINAAAEAGTAASAAPLTGQQINQYLSPYLGDVLSSTEAIQNQENQQAQAGQLGNAITSGAFGSDRTGIAAANLLQQEDLANSNVISGIANTGYQSALSTAQGQQQIGLAGAQQLANIGSTAYGEGANTASELGALGTGAQTAGLAGASAQLSAGTVEQQTQQAQDTAQYNQFLQQQSYPFQVDQFLANIAEGTGALSGSTTTTTQPGGFFSDRRLKHSIRKIGKTYDGQHVYSYKMGEDPRTHIGLIAQEVEKKHPEAVGVAAGFKTVDYEKATKKAANDGHFAAGGVVPIRRHRDTGGGLAGVLAAQQQMYAPMAANGTTGKTRVPAPTGSVGQLAVAHPSSSEQPSGLQNLGSLVNTAKNAEGVYNGYQNITNGMAQSAVNAGVNSAANAATAMPTPTIPSDASLGLGTMPNFWRGGRTGFASGGTPDPDFDTLNIPDDSPNAKLVVANTPGQQSGSGLQGLSSLAQIASSIAQMNRGGVARRGYADGGDPQMDDDAGTVLPEQTVTADAPAANPTPAPSGVAAAAPSSEPSSGGLAGIWNKIKDSPLGKAENLVPLLSAIGAMGTAKTVHPGVALAAGLGAGAQSYVPTQEGLAKAAQTESLTQGQDLLNQITGVRVRAANDFYPAPTPGASPAQTTPTTPAPTPATAPNVSSQPPTQPSSSANTTAGFYQEYKDKYLVNTARTPEEQAAKDKALGQSWALDTDVPVKRADSDFQNRVVTDTLQKQNAARQEAAGLYQQATDPTADQQARQAAADRYNAVMQFTGDKYTSIEGSIRNDRTAAPAVGVAAQTLTPAQKADRYAQAWAPVTIGNDLPKPAWQAYKFPSPDAYLDAAASAALGASGAPVPAGGAASTQAPTAAPSPSGAAPTGAGAIAPTRTAPAPQSAAAPTNPAQVIATVATKDPYLGKALSDPKYNAAPLPPVTDNTTKAKALEMQDINLKASKDLKDEAAAATDAASAGLQYTNAARAIMQSKGAPVTGLYGNAANLVSRVFGGVDSSNYQKVAKYLGNAAAQNAQVNFPAATQKEVSLQFNELSPNVEMNDDTINDLLAKNALIANWTMATADRAKPYLDAGKDPQSFKEWNNTYYSRDKIINATKTATGPNGQKLYLVNGRWVP